ncbi:hypothetical protein SLA2020_296070 [Shorea laevis]
MVNCCLRAQFIDDNWELKKKVLTFERFEDDFDAASLCEIFKRVLLEWNIKEKTCSLTVHSSLSDVEIVHDKEIWPSDIFYLNYDKCIRDINCMTADISLKSIYQLYKEVNHQGYKLMSVECSNNWRICSLILAVVTILHPCFKFKFVEFVYEKVYGVVVAKQHLEVIFDFLVSVYDKYACNGNNQSELTTAQFDANDEVMESFRKHLASRPNQLELHQYLEENEYCSMEKIGILKFYHHFKDINFFH